ncbi:MAG: bacterial Ig-like domain-containing protein [Clostridia bacterium]|nr:bacterial Ig-like domain-containing protein [Clostridia bacterium]
MKKRLIMLALFVLAFAMILTSCDALLKGDKEVSKLTIVDGTFKYSYEVGETADLSKIKVQADYNDGTSKVLSYTDLVISKIDTSVAGTKTVTITYEKVTLEVDVKVETKADNEDETPVVTLSSIAIDASSVATRVIKGEAYSTENIKVIATYSDNTTKIVPVADLTVGTVDTTAAGNKTLTVTYQEKSAELTVSVVEVKALQIIGNGANGITVMQGGTISTDAFTAFATYTDGVVESVANAALTFNVPATDEAGSKTITVTYRGFDATIPVTVKAPATVIGIEVDFNSIKDYTVVADGVALDMDAIKANIVVTAVYGYVNGTATEIERKEVITDKSAITITETTEPTRYITVSYSGKTVDISISETAAVVTGIELTSYSNGVKVGKNYDYSNIKILVTYSNGATEELSYGAAGVTVNQISTAAAGTEKLTVGYANFSDEASVTVYGVSSITPIGTLSPVVVGETLSYAGLELLVTYADNETETVSIADVTVGAIDTATAGDKAFTVTYYATEGTVPYTVIGVKSVAINAGTITTNFKVGDEFTYANATITVTYTNDTTATFNVAEALAAGVTFNTGAIDTGKVGEYDFTVTYKGVTSAAVKIKYKAVDYEIIGVSEPGSITTLETNKKYYLNGSYGYLVGDDNPFKYSLTLSAYNFKGEKVTVTRYTSKSLVYLVEGDTILNTKETLLEGDALAQYVVIDEANNTFDFTEAAVGKKFKIATRPAYGITVEDESEYAEYTRTHTFSVVDAYNVYDAKGLHVMTNTDDVYNDENKLKWSQDFLKNNGYEVPDYEIKGIVLHNDINITKADLPAEYFEATGELKDFMSIFIRDMSVGDFTIHGNYFTVYTYNIPSIKDNETHDKNSHTQLFRFENDNEETNPLAFNHLDYKLRVENLYILDNDPNDPLNSDSVRSRLGLIGMKIAHCDATLDNVVAERYYITILGEYDNTVLNINQSKLYNAWQNHIFLWSKNGLVGKDENPPANHVPLQCNITNSEITTCGGPIIISQTSAADETRQDNSGADVYIDDATKIYTYVTADSTWFVAMGAKPYVTPIISLNGVMKGYNGSTYIVEKAPDGSEGEFLNFVMVTLNGGETMAEILGGADIDGTLTVDGKLVSTMDNDTMLLENMVKEAIKGVVGEANLGSVPILKSSNGGWAYIGQDANGYTFNDLSPMLNPQLAALGLEEIPKFAPEENGGYITLYYMGMAIVLDDFRPVTAG